MSHMVKIDIIIRDLDLLEQLCNQLGFKFKRNQKQARYYGGNTKHCDHVIEIPGSSHDIAIIQNNDGTYSIEIDSYGEAGKKTKKMLEKLLQLYGVEVTKRFARRKGKSIMEQWLEDGDCLVTIYN